MASYLITGGAGFIGSHIAKEIIKRGDSVRVFDNFSTGRYENLSEIASDIDLIEGDIRDFSCISKAMTGIDYVLHQAAAASVPASIEDPAYFNANNIDGTLNVLMAAAKADVNRVVLASSAAVYGDSPELPKQEDFVPDCLSPYALSKLAGELYAKIYSRLHGLSTVCLRYFNVYGPRQDPSSPYAAALPIFFNQLANDQAITIFGDGEQSRDFVFVSDVVEANLLATQSQGVGDGEVFNIACGERVSVNNLLANIGKLLAKELIIEYHSTREGDIKHSEASIKKAHEMLGYLPLVKIEEGLSRCINWYLHS